MGYRTYYFECMQLDRETNPDLTATVLMPVLMTIANNLDPNEAQQMLGFLWDPNCLTFRLYNYHQTMFFFHFGKKNIVCLKQITSRQRVNFANRRRIIFISSDNIWLMEEQKLFRATYTCDVISENLAHGETKRTGYYQTPRGLRGVWFEPWLFDTYIHLQKTIFSLFTV